MTARITNPAELVGKPLTGN